MYNKNNKEKPERTEKRIRRTENELIVRRKGKEKSNG
jgi:hypothetical protein